MRRRLFAEVLGTFAIVFFGCGAVATGGTTLGVALVFGLVVAALVYALGHISAAHFNPAVTFGFALGGRFPWRLVPAYVAAQALGAVLASGAHALLLPARAAATLYGASVPHIDPLRCVGVEALLTFFLMLVIASVATDRRTDGAVPGLAIGAMVAVDAAMGGPLTGASMNPARSLGPALFAHTVLWPYVVGPLLGAGLAARAYEALRGGDEHGKNAPNDLEQALERIEEA